MDVNVYTYCVFYSILLMNLLLFVLFTHTTFTMNDTIQMRIK